MSGLHSNPIRGGARLRHGGRWRVRSAVGARRDARHRPWVVMLAVLALCSWLVACGGVPQTASDVAVDSTSQPETSESQDGSPVDDGDESGADDEPTGEAEGSGEIWQWALGRSIWDDQALADLASTMGPSDDSISMQPDGYQLEVDTSGRVSAVLLFNDEVALGLPASDSSFSAYEGALPGDLTWQDTYDTVVGRYGEGSRVTGGWGVSYSFAYPTEGGYEIDLTFLAVHEDELPGAPLHIVTLRVPPR